MADFRPRTPSAPLGIGKPVIGPGGPIPDKYKVKPKLEEPVTGFDGTVIAPTKPKSTFARKEWLATMNQS